MLRDKSVVNILKDQILDNRIINDIQNCPNSQYEFDDLLITGVTGFLGAHTLAKILESLQDRHIYCMIRGIESDRVKNTLIDYKLWKDEFDSKFTVINGDLSKENFGLFSSTYNELLLNISQILHIAADTNHVKIYSQLRDANVQGTVELIKLSSKVRKKEIVYISTMSVLDALGVSDEDTELTNPELIDLGYIQTKYVSEKLLLQAKEAGMKVDIIRVGRVAPSTVTGIWRSTDGYNMIFESFYKLNMVPEIKKIPLFFTPVDYMSICINKIISTDINPNGLIFHLHNNAVPIYFKACYKALKSIKPDCRLVTHKEWRDTLMNEADKELQMCEYISDMYLPVEIEDCEELENQDPISTEKTLKIFRNYGIPELTEFKEDYIEKIFTCIKEKLQSSSELHRHKELVKI